MLRRRRIEHEHRDAQATKEDRKVSWSVDKRAKVFTSRGRMFSAGNDCSYLGERGRSLQDSPLGTDAVNPVSSPDCKSH